MKKIEILLIPPNNGKIRNYNLYIIYLYIVSFLLLSALGSIIYFMVDYYKLRKMENTFFNAIKENKEMQGEFVRLIGDLDTLKDYLSNINLYTDKLSKLTKLSVNKFKNKTKIDPIGPLNIEEYRLAKKSEFGQIGANLKGINFQNLYFKNAFKKLHEVKKSANDRFFQLKKLMIELENKKSILSSVPTIMPTKGGWISSYFGTRKSPFSVKWEPHNGIDIAANIGEPVYATANGVVIYSEHNDFGYGNMIKIAHDFGIITKYAHLQKNLVRIGQKVIKGQKIGVIGITGRTTGPHLHYEVVKNFKHENPMGYILSKLW